MTKAELGEIISRVFALFLFLGSLSLIVSVPALFVGETYLTVIYSVSITVHIALAFIFWFKASAFGKAIVVRNQDKEIALPRYHQIMHVLFIGFGLWMMSKAIPDISTTLAYIASEGLIEGNKIRGFNYWEHGLRITFYLGLGLFLILRSEGLRRILTGIKTAGLDEQ